MKSQHCNLLLLLLLLLLRLLGGGDQRCARMRKLVPFDLVVVSVFVLGSIVSPFSMVAEGAHFRFVPRSPRNLAENSYNHAVPAHLAPPLEFGFYHKTCPQFPEIVKRVVTKEFELNPTNAAPQLRLFFHDCFVQGCDASVLLNSTKVNQAEKDASNNFSLGNFFVIDEVKEQLEKECPGVVSCADILALVAVYSVKAAGGPLYEIELGRKDSLTSYAPSAETYLPASSLNVSGLLEDLQTVGLDEVDLVALSGAHTIGQAHCSSIINRLYPHVDSQYPKYYSQQLVANCTDNGYLKLPNYDNNTQFFNDPVTPLQFDNQYFKNLKENLGLFTTDESLFNDERTKKLVETFASNQDAFFKQFGISLRKMGKIGVLTGTQGQIRNQCWVRNSHNVDPALDPTSLDFVS